MSNQLFHQPFNLPELDPNYINYRHFDFSLSPQRWANTGFSLEKFLARFWCGDSAIRQHLSLSRKRLTLSESGVPNQDAPAMQLNRQISQYQKAYQLILGSQKLSPELLCRANSYIASSHANAGKLRKNQTFIGDKDNPNYVCPPAKRMDKLLKNLCDFANDDRIPPLAKAITVHCQFLAIHPFSDGNGRVSRLLLDAMLARYSPDYLSILLYRIDHNTDHIQAVRQFGTDGTRGLLESYWTKAFQYSEALKGKINEFVQEGQRELMAKAALFAFGPDQKHLLESLWNLPILFKNRFSESHGWSDSRFSLAFEPLVKAGILQIRTLSKPEGELILDCPIIFRVWGDIDSLIFES